ncbi:MAG TPA: 50S ribosomal protein L4 [Solirubrobacteraceae bacterium]|nr:50S ribosomal protein L4 [Solirubrobacteraceae bacterium]
MPDVSAKTTRPASKTRPGAKTRAAAKARPTSGSAKTGAASAKTPEAPVLGAGSGAGAGAGRTVTLSDGAFAARFNEPLVHQSVRAEQAARRRGTASTKTRGLVSGGGAKPWRQKGTGRARAGSSRSPIWTGGGTVFGPHPRSYTFKVNRKEQRAALRSALSLHAQRGSIAVLDPAAFSAPKTSQAAELLEDWSPLTPAAEVFPALVVLAGEERDAALSFRNLARVAVLTHENVGVADLLGAASLLISEPALDALSARAAGEPPEARAAAKVAKTVKTPVAAEIPVAAEKPAVAEKPVAVAAAEPAATAGEAKD